MTDSPRLCILSMYASATSRKLAGPSGLHAMGVKVSACRSPSLLPMLKLAID